MRRSVDLIVAVKQSNFCRQRRLYPISANRADQAAAPFPFLARDVKLLWWWGQAKLLRASPRINRELFLAPHPNVLDGSLATLFKRKQGLAQGNVRYLF